MADPGTKLREELGRVRPPARDLEGVRRRALRLRMRRWVGGAVAVTLAVAGVALPLWTLVPREGPRLLHTPDPATTATTTIGDPPDAGERGWEPPSFEAAQGWHTATTGPVDPDTDWAPVSWAANAPFDERDLEEALEAGALGFPPQHTLAGLAEDGIVLVAAIFNPADWPAEPTETLPQATLPLSLDDADVRGNWEGQVSPDVPEYVLWRTVEGWMLDVRLYFGTQDPSAEVLAAAREQLIRLRLPEPPPPEASTITHADRDDGVSIPLPSGWAFHQDPSGPDDPRTLFAFGTWAFPTGGDCAPIAAQAELPAAGALVWMMEYPHPEVTDFIGEVLPRPENFTLEESTLGTYECSLVPSYSIRFFEFGRDERVFQLHVAFGPEATAERRDQVLAALDDMVITAPVPETCPYDFGPWGDPDCPAQAWVRAVAHAVGAPVTDNTGSALELDLRGHRVHMWAFLPESDGAFEDTLTAEGYTWRWGFGTDVYSDGVRIAWMADGLWVWLSSAGPDPLPSPEIVEELVRASLAVDYDAIDTR